MISNPKISAKRSRKAVIGSRADIEKVPIDKLAAFYRKYYQPDNAVLVIAGQRAVPPELRTAVIHRLELPQGRFERRVPLPPGRYSDVRRSEAHGCLVISLSKAQ